MDETEQQLIIALFDAKGLTWRVADATFVVPPPHTGQLFWSAFTPTADLREEWDAFAALGWLRYDLDEGADLMAASDRLVTLGFVQREHVRWVAQPFALILRPTSAGIQLGATLKLIDRLAR